MQQRVVIVGAGQAGARCAEALRSLGHEGPITLLGEEPVAPYERPPLSKSLLAGESSLGDAQVLPDAWWSDNHVELCTGRHVAHIDRSARRVLDGEGRSSSYDVLVLATGSRPRRLRCAGHDLDGVLTLRSAADALELRGRLTAGHRLIIVGAGFVGLEVAATARELGVDVTVLEASAAPMARAVPPEVGALFVDLHARHGVKWRLRTTLCAIEALEGALSVRLSDGETLPADTVLIGIGIIPNVELAEAAGLAVDDGVLVDASGRTSDPHIYATGDCARCEHPLLSRAVRLEAWQHAERHAQAVAASIVGGTQPYAEVPWAWSDQYDVNLQVTGAPARWDRTVWRGDPVSMSATLFQLVDAPDGLRVVGAVSVSRPRDSRAARQMIERNAVVDVTRLTDCTARLP